MLEGSIGAGTAVTPDPDLSWPATSGLMISAGDEEIRVDIFGQQMRRSAQRQVAAEWLSFRGLSSWWQPLPPLIPRTD